MVERIAMEPASGQERPAGELTFHTWAPICNTCGEEVRWRRAPIKTRRGVYLYPIACACGLDHLESEFRLLLGGGLLWWESIGYKLNHRGRLVPSVSD